MLIIDLSSRETMLQERTDLTPYLGGVALGIQLMKEHSLFEEEPLSPQQPMILAKGPLNTIFPVVTKTCALFKSPLTGELGESYAGMRLSMAMGMAGIDAIVIKGSSAGPIYLHIDGDHVKFKNAEPLWGLNIDETTRLLHDAPGRRGLRSILAIGQAGERCIAYACATVDTYRHFGRLGLGAVMGSKKIKAMVIEGSSSQPIADINAYQRTYREIYKKVTETDLMEKYHGLGTSVNIKPLNDMRALPSYNFSKNQFQYSEELCGEAMAERELIRKIACSGCPIGCIHIALLRKQFDDPYEFEATTLAYDHELIYSLGTMLGVDTRQGLLRLMERVELLGFDAITVGVLLAWITEAFNRSILSEEELLVAPEFGKVEGYLQIMELLLQQPNAFYKAAAKGTYWVADKYKSLDFAAVLGKNEVAGYHTGYGNVLGHAVGARHSHLDNAGYSADQELEDPTDEELVKRLIKEETERNLLNSLTICLFARKIYDNATVVKALSAIGISLTEEELTAFGIATFVEKLWIKEKMGFSFKALYFPKRFFETPARDIRLSKDRLDKMLGLYMEEVEKLKKQYSSEAGELFAYSEEDKSLI